MPTTTLRWISTIAVSLAIRQMGPTGAKMVAAPSAAPLTRGRRGLRGTARRRIHPAPRAHHVSLATTAKVVQP
jgi:hypothetical protein